MIARRVLVRGRVQGVFFRDTCRRAALAQGVSGWVRNRSDGCVEALFEGQMGAVDAMVAWCRVGPPYAAVEAVEVSNERPSGASGFRIAPST